MFKGWSWQKWVSRGSKAALGIALVIFKLAAPEVEPNWLPSWWATLSPVIVLVVDAVLALFPPKPVA
jgi:hypothetical protein